MVADIYVLALCDADSNVRLVGWEWGKVLARTEARDDYGYGYISHSIEQKYLRDMSELSERIMHLH